MTPARRSSSRSASTRRTNRSTSPPRRTPRRATRARGSRRSPPPAAPSGDEGEAGELVVEDLPLLATLDLSGAKVRVEEAPEGFDG